MILGLSLLGVQKGLQVVNVLDGGSEGFHFAESLVQVLLRQVVAELRVAVIDALHPLPFSLIPPPDKGRPVGVVAPSVVAGLESKGLAQGPRGAGGP